MGGCATKPKVAKDGEEPEPEPQQVKEEDIVETKHQSPEQEEQRGVNVKNFDEFIDDDQGNTRHSLSLLFNKENEDEKVSTEDEKTKAEETVKHETLEDKKPLEDAKSIEPTVKDESPKKEQILYRESKISEPFEKQESALQNQPAAETVKTETPEAGAKETVVILNRNTNEAENENAKVSTENEKTKVEETVKQETFEDKKPLEGAKISEPIVKQESPKAEEKLFQETKINEPVVAVDVKEKPTLQNKIADSAAEVTVKTETPEEAKKISQETKINEPVVEETAVKQNRDAIAAEATVTKTETPEAEVAVIKTETPEVEKVSEKTQRNELNEPIKQQKSFETNPIEDAGISPPKKKVIEVILPNAESVENKAVETTSSTGEKNHVDVVGDHTHKVSDAGTDKVSLS